MKPCDPFPLEDSEVKHATKMWGLNTFASARRRLMQQRERCRHYEDMDHEAIVSPINVSKMVQIVVRRKDGEKVKDHWKTLQRIKNEILGANWFAYEVYPSQNLVIDTANSYHLWATPYQLFHTYTQEEADALR